MYLQLACTGTTIYIIMWCKFYVSESWSHFLHYVHIHVRTTCRAVHKTVLLKQLDHGFWRSNRFLPAKIQLSITNITCTYTCQSNTPNDVDDFRFGGNALLQNLEALVDHAVETALQYFLNKPKQTARDRPLLYPAINGQQYTNLNVRRTRLTQCADLIADSSTRDAFFLAVFDDGVLHPAIAHRFLGARRRVRVPALPCKLVSQNVNGNQESTAITRHTYTTRLCTQLQPLVMSRNVSLHITTATGNA